MCITLTKQCPTHVSKSGMECRTGDITDQTVHILPVSLAQQKSGMVQNYTCRKKYSAETVWYRHSIQSKNSSVETVLSPKQYWHKIYYSSDFKMFKFYLCLTSRIFQVLRLLYNQTDVLKYFSVQLVYLTISFADDLSQKWQTIWSVFEALVGCV